MTQIQGGDVAAAKTAFALQFRATEKLELGRPARLPVAMVIPFSGLATSSVADGSDMEKRRSIGPIST